jgi:hypothetical protein
METVVDVCKLLHIWNSVEAEATGRTQVSSLSDFNPTCGKEAIFK